MITKEKAIAEVTKWINSSLTIEQVECCAFFIQDTLYMRFDANDSEMQQLRNLVEEKKQQFEIK
jgi:hypothetical protein